MRNFKYWLLLAFAVCLTLASWRAYRYPEYSTDGFSYMGNAVAMSGAGIQVIHDSVYREARAGMPRPEFDHLTGNDPSEPASERNSFHQRAVDAYRFAEFLPCFAIRPVFNELVYVLHFKLGVGLLKATVLLAVVSYWLLGWVVLAWTARYTAVPWAAPITILLLLSPPVWDLARSTTPDALSTLVVLLAIYLLFERQKLLPGMILLLASVYVRTDNLFLVVPVLAFLYVTGSGLKATHAVALSALAFVSVLVINHFAGDYGAKVLYYRSFVEPPIAVGEIVPRFGIHEYLTALKAGIGGALHGPYIPFLLMGIVGLLRRASRAVVGLIAVTVVYTAAHLIIFPNPEPRFFGAFFAAMGIALASTLFTSSSEQLGTAQLATLRRDDSGVVHALAGTQR